MKKFLTFTRLEHLYNLDDKTSHSIRYLSTNAIIKRRITIPMIGQDWRICSYFPKIFYKKYAGAIVENLMGGNYRSYYTSRNFRYKYNKSKEKLQVCSFPLTTLAHKSEVSMFEYAPLTINKYTGINLSYDGLITSLVKKTRIAEVRFWQFAQR